MVVRQVRSWVGSARVSLGTSALADIVARFPADLLAPLLSISGGTLGSPAVGFVTTWVMFGVAFWTFGPYAYRHLADDDSGSDLPRETLGFRAIFTISSVSFGVLLQRVASVGPAILLLVPGAFLSGALFLAYLVREHQWNLKAASGEAVALLDAFTPGQDAQAEIESDLAYEGLLGVFGLLFYLLAVMFILGLPTVLAAFAVQILVYAYPLPEIVFLGWAVSAAVAPRLSVGPSKNRILKFEFEFERVLLEMVEYATRSTQGFFRQCSSSSAYSSPRGTYS
jgi:hypothetical protein